MPYDNENNEETTEMMNVFIPIQKVNMERREVWGWGALEEPDNSDEILDYASSKPNFIDWSQKTQKRSGGKSLGNVRAMHQNIAAGKLIELKADDVHKGFYVGAKIVDDNEWKKVVSGVYTGFSVGGAYEKRWSDFQNPGKIRYTARPTELSIVDSPCIPSATFDMVKADGSLVKRKFKPGEGKNMIAVVTEPRMIKVASSSRLIKVEWDESKHPRAEDGKFGSGGGGGGGGKAPAGKPIGQSPKSPPKTADLNELNIGATRDSSGRPIIPPKKQPTIENNPDRFAGQRDMQKPTSSGGGGSKAPDVRSEGAESFHSPAPKRTPKEPKVMSEGADTYSYPKESQRPGFSTQTGYGGHADAPKSEQRAREKEYARTERANAAYADNPKKPWQPNPQGKEKPPAEWGQAHYSSPKATTRQQRQSLFNLPNSDTHFVTMEHKQSGEKRTVSADKARNMLYDVGAQDDESEWNIRDATPKELLHLPPGTKFKLPNVPPKKWDDETPAEFKARHAEKVTKGDGMPEEFVDDEEFAEDEIPEEELEKEEVEEEFDEEEFDKADDEELPEDDLDEEFEDLDETAPEASTEEVMKIVQSALVDVGELLMAAERVLAKRNGKVPESPEPIADIPLPGKLEGGSFTAEQMPAPSVLLEINPNSVPAQQVLAEHAVMSKDLTDAFNAWMPQVGAMVKTAVAEEVKKVVAGLLKNTNSAPVQISQVSPRIIKVRKENTQ